MDKNEIVKKLEECLDVYNEAIERGGMSYENVETFLKYLVEKDIDCGVCYWFAANCVGDTYFGVIDTISKYIDACVFVCEPPIMSTNKQEQLSALKVRVKLLEKMINGEKDE